MATVPEANRTLWEALEAIYAAQRDAVARAGRELEKLQASHPELAHDPLARGALQAATTRQEGMRRYAESQVGLAETMRSYWDQRREPERDTGPVPLVRPGGPQSVSKRTVPVKAAE